MKTDIWTARDRYSINDLGWTSPDFDKFTWLVKHAARHYNARVLHFRCIAMQQLTDHAGQLWALDNGAAIYEYMLSIHEQG